MQQLTENTAERLIQEERFNNLFKNSNGDSQESRLVVPKKMVFDLLFGSKNPETLADAPNYSPTKEHINAALEIAEKEKAFVGGLESYPTPFYIASAGGPGSGKTTFLFQRLAELFHIPLSPAVWQEPTLETAMNGLFPENPKEGVRSALVAPDRRGLFALAVQETGKPECDRDFYLKNRVASIFLSNTVLNLAFMGRKNIVHDTTLSSPYAVANMEMMVKDGYYVAVFMQGSPRPTRKEAARIRNQTFFQSLEANVIEQDEAFSAQTSRILDASHQVVIGWRDGVNEPSRTVAKIFAGQNAVIFDTAGFGKFCETYPSMSAEVKNMNLISDKQYFDWLGRLADQMRGKANVFPAQPGFLRDTVRGALNKNDCSLK